MVVDLGRFEARVMPQYEVAHWGLYRTDANNPIHSLDVFVEDASKVPIEGGGRRYRLLLIIEQDEP